jgi:hypothetical protein
MSHVLTRVTQMFTALGSKLFQGIATMTYTRSHTRPSQKDLGCVVYPLNNKSLVLTIAQHPGTYLAQNALLKIINVWPTMRVMDCVLYKCF